MIDGQIYQSIIGLCLFLAYISLHDLDYLLLLQGSIATLCYLVGEITLGRAMKYGPGGPVQALILTEIIYLTFFNSMYLDQTVTTFQYLGIVIGIHAALIISCGD